MTHQDDWDATLPLAAKHRLDRVCERFEAACMAEEYPRIEDFLGEFNGLERAALLGRLLHLELDSRHDRGETAMPDDYLTRFADDAQIVRKAIRTLAGSRDPTAHAPAFAEENGLVEGESQPAVQIRCPRCQNAVEVSSESSFQQILCSSCHSHFSLVGEPEETRDPSEVFSLGHFELIERLGTGGYGTVWKARDKVLDRIVAVKVPRQDRLSSSEAEKFLREARAAAQLKHPNIVSIHEIGRAGDTVYIVSDLVEGVSLSSWLSAKRVTAREAAQICAKIADALDHSHRAGVVHRDLKLPNILMDAAGEPHVTDFGLARREFGEVTMTIDGQVLGTPAYMSPEQASGKSHRADCRSDIYSLGVILFRLLTGEMPFRGNTNMLIHQVLHDEPPSPRKLDSSVPRDLETICLKCLEKDASKRYQNARDGADELHRFLRGEPIQARPIGTVTRTWRWCKRNPSVAALLAAIGCLMLLGTVVSAYFAKVAIDVGEVATEQTAQLARVSSGLASALAMRDETEGYRPKIWDLIEDTMRLGGNVADRDELRRAAVATMGDFAGLPPAEYADFQADISAMAAHPTGRMSAVGLNSGAIRFVDPGGNLFPQTLTGHDHEVIGLAFATGGSQLISVDAQGGIRYWKSGNAEIWEQADDLRFEVPSGGIESAQITLDRKYLLTSSSRGIVLRQLPDGQGVWSREVSAERRPSLAVCSADGRFLAVVYRDNGANRVMVVDRMRPDDEYDLRFRLDPGRMDALTFSPDGKHLVCGCEQALVHFEVEAHADGTFEFFQRPVIHTDAIQALTFSSDNQFLVSVDLRGVLTVRSVSTGEELAVVEHRPKGQPKFQFLAFSADGTYLSAANLNSVKFWRFSGATERKVFSGHALAIPSVVFSPDGNLIVTGGKDKQVVVWGSNTGEKLAELALTGKVQCVTLDAYGKWLATALWDSPLKAIQVWNVDRLVKDETASLITSIEHGLGEVNRLVFFGEHNRLAAAGDDGVMYWDIQARLAGDGTPRIIPHAVVDSAPAKYYLDVAISSDEKLLAYTADRETMGTQIGVWDLDAAKPVTCKPPPMLQGWHGLAFIPGSHQLMFVNSDGLAEVWDVDNDVSLQPLDEKKTFGAPHLALSESGQWFAGLVKPDSVGIWDATTRRHLFDLRPERNAIWALAWSPDETRLALGLSDGGLTVWDLSSVNKQLVKLGLNWQAPPPE